MKLKAFIVVATFLLALVPMVCHAQEFSADIEYVATGKPGAPATGTGTSPHPASKLYVSKNKMRLETHGITGTILLTNVGDMAAVALFPSKKEYQPLPAGPSEYFRVENAEDACADWQKASGQTTVCEKVGPETVDGRKAVKYQNKGASDTAITAVWIDLALKFVVKWLATDTGAELRNIKEAPQAGDLFALPSDYKAVKPLKASQKGYTPRTR